LKEEDESDERICFLKKLKDQQGNEEDNFFLDDDAENMNGNEGIEELDMRKDGECENIEMLDKEKRNLEDQERGYFLQPIYAQKLSTKIYLYEDKVNQLMEEFRNRLDKKRTIIRNIKHKCKELNVKDATLLCEKCNLEVALLKTVNFVNEEKH
jgi:type IV secretory pathway VirB9-like protein